MGDYVRALSESLQVPPDLAAAAGLSILVTACGGKVDVFINEDWSEQTNLFTIVALPSGEGKSAVYKKMYLPLQSYENQLRQAFPAKKAVEQSLRKGLEARLKMLEAKRLKAAPGDPVWAETEQAAIELAEMPETFEPLLYVDDITPEKVVGMLREQGGRLAVLSDECGLFDTIAGRYSNGMPNLDVFLKGFSGTEIKVHRMGRTAEHVGNPALTMGISIQPSVLRSLGSKENFHSRGFLARFLFAVPKSLLGYRNIRPATIIKSITDIYNLNITHLLELNTDPTLILSDERALGNG